jgi:hypothetical protein
VFGELSGNSVSASNEMTYDFDKQQYTASLYLKQGYYNYKYAYVDSERGQIDFSYAEGNYFETENEYLILVYQHSYDRDYDRLLGISVINQMR